jgi:hypothetical protein
MQHQISIQDLLSGKTFLELSATTKGKISRPSSKRSVGSGGGQSLLYLNLQRDDGLLLEPLWEMVAALPGASMMLNFGESPSAVRESTLSQILEANVPEKYYLSARACRGILNRAAKRGKELPAMLKEALEEVIA